MFIAPNGAEEEMSGGSMRKRLGFLSVSSFTLSLLMIFVTYTFAAQPPDPQTRPHIDDELIVKFRVGRDDYSKLMTHYGVGARRAKVFRNLASVELVKLPRGLSVKEAIDFYQRSPDVLYAEPNYIVRTTNIPDDTRFGEQWGLHNIGQSGGTPNADIDAVAAWDITTGSSDVIVAVIDSGVDYNHLDLSANMFQNTADCNNDGIDDDGNGFVDDCFGIDTANNDSDPMDDNNHGSHVAGIIGAVGNNNAGVTGINHNIKIIACKFVKASGSGTTADAIDCLDYVKTMKDRGFNIIATSNSWGGGGFSQALLDAIDEQRQRGMLFITAAGNGNIFGIGQNNDNTPFYPCNYYLPNVICVASTTRTDASSTFSNFGRRTVHVGAPGSEILSTIRGNSYASQSGTSMATPHVTGVAALLQAGDPSLDWRSMKNLILAGGDNLASLANTITQKRINAFSTLTCTNSIVASRLRPIGNSVSGSVGTPIDLAALNINCANPNGNIDIMIDPVGEIVTLLDDGLSSDQVAADGIYSGQWTPSATGVYTLTFPWGEVLTVNVAMPVISVSPNSVNFGGVNVGGSADRTFTVQNVGGGVLTGNATTNAPFAIVSGSSYSLSAGQSQTVTVRFSPTSAETFLGNVNLTGGGGASLAVSGTGVIPPNIALNFDGKLRDRVGRGDKLLSADGSLDATFTVSILPGSGNRTVTQLVLRRSGGSGIWNTTADSSWALGAAASLDAVLYNNSANASVNFAVSEGGSFNLFASDGTGSTYFPPGSTFNLTATFADGSTATASATVPAPPSANIALNFDGKLRDRVGRGDKLLSADGSFDATFTVNVLAGSGNRTVTKLELRRSDNGGIWNTTADTIWVLGAAASLDAPLYNNSANASVNFAVSEGGSVNLFASDGTGGTYFPPGSTFNLTATFADGSTATAAVTVAGGQSTVAFESAPLRRDNRRNR
jgi:subtilisin family serine protease